MIALAILLFFLGFNSEVSAAKFTNATDCQALLTFKALISEDPNGYLSSWNDSISLCNWHGVTCSRLHNRVTALNLQARGLMGLISPSIGNLTFLRSIQLQNNHFYGTIPQEIGSLSRLQHVNLTYNSIQSEIPTNLSSCFDLRVFEINFNDLIGEIPDFFGSLSKLTRLSLFSNDLTGRIPSSLGNLTFLERLSIGTNHLIGTIPSSLGHFTKLKFFGAGLNNLTGFIPPSLYNMSSLTNLVIPNNNFTGTLPLDIGFTLPNLRILSVGGTLLDGPIPVSFSNASKLELLDISFCDFSGPVPVDFGNRMSNFQWLNLIYNNLGSGKEGDLRFIDSFTNCSKLRIFAIEGNNFGGVISTSLGNLSTELTSLSVGGNKFMGTIPVGICNLFNLEELGLESNQLHGHIPFDIGKMQSLGELSLEDNNLSGPIPISIGNLSQIFYLSSSRNKLSGSISVVVDNVRGLQTVDLSSNKFTGFIPKTIGSLKSATFLNFSYNSLSGLLPLEIGSLNNLQELDLSNNKFSGDIPSTFGNCLKMEVLILQSNLLQGEIPSSLSLLKGFTLLDVSHNKMSGKIPISLGTLTNMKLLNLSFNEFDGEVPLAGVFKNSSVISVAGNPRLCGGISALHLPGCSTPKTSKKIYHRYLRIILITFGIAGSILILISIFIIWARKRNHTRPSPETNVGNNFMRLSYGELFTATEGFSLSNLIGTGKFSSVYKGFLQSASREPIAVKVLNLEVIGASNSFISECEALKITRHRNLVKVITACSSLNNRGEDFKALVFEYMPNGSLEDWLHPQENEGLQERNLDLSQRLKIIIDVASALDYLHNQCQPPLVHCDLKPSNVLLDLDLTSHVGDFGLAKFLSLSTYDTGDETSSVAIKGTIGYVPPEYGMGGQVSTQGDIYSYGILVLEMITGKRPTNEMFGNGMSLHDYCKKALSERVVDIADPRLLCEPYLDDNAQLDSRTSRCLSSLLSVGVACSAELPTDRINIKNLVMRLNDATRGT